MWLWGTHPIPKWNNPEILLWVWQHCLLTPHSAVTVTVTVSVAAIVTLAFDLLTYVDNIDSYYVGLFIVLRSYVCRILGLYHVLTNVCGLY